MNVLPFTIVGRDNPVKIEKNKTPKPRSINLPTWLWDELDKDADRCLRSSVKQLEAFLTVCFDPEADLEIDKETIRAAYEVASRRQLKKAG